MTPAAFLFRCAAAGALTVLAACAAAAVAEWVLEGLAER